MPNLFDLPFEEAKPEPDPEPAPAPVTPVPQPSFRTRVEALRRESGPPARAVISVSELNANIRDLLEAQMFDVWVEGEISNCRLWNTGHLYFTLKDRSAQIKAV